MSEPKVKEVRVNVSVGGKIQVVQFQYTSDFHYSVGKTYEVEMSDSDADEFWQTRLDELREELEPIQQKEIDELQTLRDELSQSGGS